MADKLIIVESPTKIKSLQKIVGDAYDFAASVGHIRDLPKKVLGVDVENNFTPTYEALPRKKKVIGILTKEVKKHKEILLACDPDREGEAIAWHIKELLKIPEKKYFRITTNEITKEGIQHALENPRKINLDMVNAQQARRILDRLVGYQISPLLWKKIRRGLSAGRVQSIAVKLIVERENLIQAFEPEEYWKISADCAKQDDEYKDMVFTLLLTKEKGKKVSVTNEEQATIIVNQAKKEDFIVSEIKKKKTSSSPHPPFKTSTLQRSSSTVLRYSAKKTMVIAQQLYEGVDLGSKGSTALITYMRTDSFQISSSALERCRSFIKETYGDKYLPEKPKYYKTKQRAQEAHEAIRPTDVTLTPDSIEDYLSPEQFKLYTLIWNQFVSSQMTNATYNSTALTILAGDYTFYTTGREMLFDGFTKLTGAAKRDMDKEHIPPLTEGEKLDVKKIDPTQHFTKPPQRYTQASLIKTLESEGIGRPSTYATIITTIQTRKYVGFKNGSFYATLLGKTVTEKLDKYFIEIMDVAFTARMEENLDDIAEAQKDWIEVLRDFYKQFSSNLTKARSKMKSTRGEEAEKTEHKCEKCGGTMVIRWGPDGPFLGCEGYYDEDNKCPFTVPLNDDGTIMENRSGPVEGAVHEESPVHLKLGRYGYYLETESGVRARIPKEVNIEELNPEIAAKLFKEAKEEEKLMGALEDGSQVFLKRGRYGPYIQVVLKDKKRNIALPKHLEPSEVTFEEAKEIASLPKELGDHPETGETVVLMIGRFGPYVKSGSKSHSTGKTALSEITLETAVELLKKKKKKKAKKPSSKKKSK